MNPEISESERFPLLTAAGRRFLHSLRQHPAAPVWNWPNGEQLDAAGLEGVQAFARQLRTQPLMRPRCEPEWLAGFVEFCLSEVPFYRRRSPAGTPFDKIPSCRRADLAKQVWEFVPDSQPLQGLIVFRSSGTTGHPATLPTHPATAAAGIPLLERVLEPCGIAFPRGVDRMALTNVAAYRGAYTTAIVIAYLAEAGCVRVNLGEEDWRSPRDRADYLNRWAADVMLGDPIAFARLREVDLASPPRVMISSVMSLSEGFAAELARRYACQVLDLYALTEAGIVACRTPHGHLVIPPDIYVEVLDQYDAPCPPGVRGEITLTGGRNPFGPLLRFRTGDFASLEWQEDRPMLVGLEGRQPVVFTTSRRAVHSMEITRALRPLPLVQFQLHQDADRLFQFRYRGYVSPDQLRAVLQDVLGPEEELDIDPLPDEPAAPRKVVQFRSDCGAPHQ